MSFNFDYTTLLDKPWAKQIIEYTSLTPVRIAIGALTLGSVCFGLSYSDNNERSKSIPLAFSEIEATTRHLSYKGQKVPALTRYYSVTNDFVMKVFEAENLSHQWGEDPKDFAYELDKKMDPAMRVHALIPQYAKELKADSRNALKSIDKFIKAKKDLIPLVSELEKTWEEDHNDVYRTEITYNTVCDSDGKNCRTETSTTQVYDHTDHSYWYHKNHGEAAAKLLIKFNKKYPNMKIDEKLILPKTTEADNENAINHSMAKYFENKLPTADQYLKMAKTWAIGSTYNQNYGPIQKAKTVIAEKDTEWQIAKNTAHDEFYSTGSSSDSGPKEYQVTEKAIEYGRNMYDAIDKTTNGIYYTNQNAQKLSDKAQELVDVTLHYKGKGDPDELDKEVKELAQNIYKTNFEGGLNTEPFSAGEVFAWTLFGLVAGGAITAGIENFVENQRTRRKDGSYRY